MKKTLLFLSISTLMMVSCKNETKDLSLNTKEDSLSYALGVNIGTSIQGDRIDTLIEVNKLISGLKAALDTGEVEIKMNADEAINFLQEYFMALKNKELDAVKMKGSTFLAENGKREGVVTTASGLQYEIIKTGNGPKPTAESVVETHYHGTFLDGKVFDSSVERGKPVEFPINRVIPGWTEALQLMPVGSKWKLWVPYQLAYGETGQQPNIPPYTTLVFEVELLGIKK
ncbi:MAG: FKBP-type peptidyl-prolyl cis-trans isomerase [Bacteroidia bacterium]